MRRFFFIALLVAIASPALAQRMGFAAPHFSGRTAPFHSPHFNRGSRGYYFPLFDPLYADDLPESPASQPPVVIVQPPAAPAAAEQISPPSQPLVIELRGDRYVQVSGDEGSHAQVIEEPALNPDGKKMRVQRPSPPQHNVVLIFRDGHREEVSNYTVADGFLYASSDYYTAGAWMRKVAVSDLNVPETVVANQSEGAAFRLPSAPNEVVIGP